MNPSLIRWKKVNEEIITYKIVTSNNQNNDKFWMANHKTLLHLWVYLNITAQAETNKIIQSSIVLLLLSKKNNIYIAHTFRWSTLTSYP